jgi:hypothetical protein
MATVTVMDGWMDGWMDSCEGVNEDSCEGVNEDGDHGGRDKNGACQFNISLRVKARHAIGSRPPSLRPSIACDASVPPSLPGVGGGRIRNGDVPQRLRPGKNNG